MVRGPVTAVYLTAHAVPAWDCPKCGCSMHARTIAAGWDACLKCQATERAWWLKVPHGVSS